MRALVDGHVLLWATGASERLSDRARDLRAGQDADLLLSAASAHEIAVRELAVTVDRALAASDLPPNHDDDANRRHDVESIW